MKRLLILAALMAALLPSAALPAPLDDALHCDRSAHDFVGPLVRDGLLDPNPSRVEPNSINAFDPVHGAGLKAFGFHVFKIVAYQQNDPMFRTGDGKVIARSAYGVVVFGTSSNVKAAVEGAQSTAIVYRVAPFITAIFCQQD
jgi:hypothetical protein